MVKKRIAGRAVKQHLEDYTKEMRRTGNCPICNKPIKRHQKCDACLIMAGNLHADICLTTFREHKLCSFCVGIWRRMDKLLGRPALWKEFAYPERYLEVKKLIGR